MRSGTRVVTSLLCALGATLCLAATASPMVRIVATSRATGLPLFGSAISRLPAFSVDATHGARAGFVAAAILAAIAAVLVLTSASRVAVTLVVLASAVFPALAAAVSWHTITGGPGALKGTGSTFLERVGGNAVALLERTDLARLRPAAGTICLTVAGGLLVVATLLSAVSGQRGTNAQ